jgi:hypothetical protein
VAACRRDRWFIPHVIDERQFRTELRSKSASVYRPNGTSLSNLKPDSEEIGKAGRHPSCPFSRFRLKLVPFVNPTDARKVESGTTSSWRLNRIQPSTWRSAMLRLGSSETQNR